MATDPYYRAVFDDELDLWILKNPVDADGREIDWWEFQEGRPYRGPTPARVAMYKDGIRAQFTFTLLDVPVVSRPVAQILRDVAPHAVELLPVQVASEPREYFVLNVTETVRCLDETRTPITYWKPEDGRPDKTGKYRVVGRLTIDPARAEGHDIFRLEGWEMALIVSDRMRRALEQFDELGLLFVDVVPRAD